MSQTAPALAHEVSSRWPKLSFLCWSAGVCALTVLWFVFSYGYVEDDAFIHLDFARSVAEGHGFAFNGLVTNGDTAPLWVLVLVAIHTLGLEWIESAKLACALGLVSTVLAIWHFAHDLAGDAVRGRRVALAAVIVTVLNPYFVHWSFAGMESVTALGVSLWALRATFVGRASWGKALTGAILLGLGPLLRPELLLLAGICGPVVLWRYGRLAPGGSGRLHWGRLALLAAIMALPLAAWCGYAIETFGSPIPNTNMAKRGGPLPEIAVRLASVYVAGFPVTLALFGLAGAARILRGKRAPVVWWILAIWPLVCVAFYLADHTLVQTRYCLLSMPCLTIVTLLLIEDPDRPTLLRASAAAMALMSLVTVVLTVIPHITNKKEGVRRFAEIAAFLQDHVPAAAPVAVEAIGELAFETRHPLVDVGGITQISVIPYLGDSKATLRWAKQNGARYFISDEAPEPGAVQVFSTRMPFFGWTLSRSHYRMVGPFSVYELP